MALAAERAAAPTPMLWPGLARRKIMRVFERMIGLEAELVTGSRRRATTLLSWPTHSVIEVEAVRLVPSVAMAVLSLVMRVLMKLMRPKARQRQLQPLA